MLDEIRPSMSMCATKLDYYKAMTFYLQETIDKMSDEIQGLKQEIKLLKDNAREIL